MRVTTELRANEPYIECLNDMFSNVPEIEKNIYENLCNGSIQTYAQVKEQVQNLISPIIARYPQQNIQQGKAVLSDIMQKDYDVNNKINNKIVFVKTIDEGAKLNDPTLRRNT